MSLTRKHSHSDVVTKMEIILEKYKYEGYGTEQSCKELAYRFPMHKVTMQLITEVGVILITVLNMMPASSWGITHYQNSCNEISQSQEEFGH